MPKQSLTIEIKDYLDERFSHVLDKIQGVDKKVESVATTLNGTVKAVTNNASKVVELESRAMQYSDLCNRIQRIEKNMKLLTMAIIIGSFLWVQESRDFVVRAILGTIGGL